MPLKEDIQRKINAIRNEIAESGITPEHMGSVLSDLNERIDEKSVFHSIEIYSPGTTCAEGAIVAKDGVLYMALRESSSAPSPDNADYTVLSVCPVQEPGQSTTAVMSQKAVTECINGFNEKNILLSDTVSEIVSDVFETSDIRRTFERSAILKDKGYAANGNIFPGEAWRHVEINVGYGDSIYLITKPAQYLTAYSKGSVRVDSGITSQSTRTYIVPEGIDMVRLSFPLADVSIYTKIDFTLTKDSVRYEPKIKEDLEECKKNIEYMGRDLSDITESLTSDRYENCIFPGGYTQNGATLSSENWKYAEAEVSEGEELFVASSPDEEPRPGNYITCYNRDTVIQSAGIGNSFKRFIVPNGVTKVRLTYQANRVYNSDALYVKRLRKVYTSKDRQVLNALADEVRSLRLNDTGIILKAYSTRTNSYATITNSVGTQEGTTIQTYEVSSGQKIHIKTTVGSQSGIASYVFLSAYGYNNSETVVASSKNPFDGIIEVPGGAAFVMVNIPAEGVGQYGAFEVKELWPTLNELVYSPTPSVAMFEKIAVCGASFTSGAIYRSNNTFIGEYNNLSWGKVMGRLTGTDVSIFASGGSDTHTWQERSNCLPALLSEPPCNLYIINLNINDVANVPKGTLEDMHEDWSSNPNTYYGNFGRIIGQIKNHAPNAKIMISKCPLLREYNQSSYYSWSSSAIDEICQKEGVVAIETGNSPFFKSDYYTKNMIGGHPTAALYSGTAKEMIRLIEETMANNNDYFKDYIG